MKQIYVDIDEQVHRQLKHFLIDNDSTIKQFVRDAIEEKLDRENPVKREATAVE